MLLLNVTEGMVLLKPCPFIYYEQYHFYLSVLGDSGVGDIASNEQLWEIFQRLINLHPRGDRQGWGFTVTDDDYPNLEGLLGQLKELNKVDPLPEKAKPKNYMDIPAKSCGDSRLDMIADLTHLFGYDAAIAIMESHGLDAINKIITRHNEITRPPGDRAQAEMEDSMARWAREDPNFYEDLGIKAE